MIGCTVFYWNIYERKKQSARWVPHLLTTDQKYQQVNLSKDENYSPELKPSLSEQRMKLGFIIIKLIRKNNKNNGLHLRNLLKKGVKTVPLAGKVMATVFCVALCIICIDILQKGKTIIGLYYALSLDHLNEKQTISCGKKKEVFFFILPKHKLICLQLTQQNCLSCDMKSYLIYPIHQKIWHL